MFSTKHLLAIERHSRPNLHHVPATTAIEIQRLQDTRFISSNAVESLLLVGDECSWISWVIHAYEFASRRT